jgi:hypothetical protein
MVGHQDAADLARAALALSLCRGAVATRAALWHICTVGG